MKESLRRVILFTVIVITGSVMILFDVPLILLIPLILAVGFIILLLLGAITVADIRSVFSRKKIKNPKKISLRQRLNEMKFFEKKTVQPDKKSASPDKKQEIPKSAPNKTGAGSHLRLFFTSLSSLGTVLKERSKHAKKVEHIDELLDKAVSEKVKSSALASAGNGVDTKIPLPGRGEGPGLKEQEKDQDPFLSLSGDEFDVSLLDGLDDQETPTSPSSGQIAAPSAPLTGSTLTINEPEIPMPSLDISSEADDILKDNEGGLEEFKGLEGGESIDQDFGDLDNVNLDDIDLDGDMEEETPSATGSSSSPAEDPGPSSSTDASTVVKTAWIASDAPKGADLPGDDISTHADMASFAGGASGSDEDLLSSLASDVKHVTKEKNTSLLRDLKDFQAPATDIENELKDMYETMKAVSDPRKRKLIPPPKRTK
jgi:hypothetical protein